jgi:hypothetical protein
MKPVAKSLIHMDILVMSDISKLETSTIEFFRFFERIVELSNVERLQRSYVKNDSQQD